MEEGSISSFGQVIVGCVVVAALVFAVAQYIGKQWVETKFAERFAKMGREHNAVVSKLTLENQSLKAAKKLQEMDFAALPGTWERLEKAYAGVRSIIRFGEYRIDVEHLNVYELDEIMGTMEWFQTEINKIKSLDGYVRQDEFDNIRFGYQVKRVKEVCDQFDAFLAENTIFYPAEMLAELQDISATLQRAVVEKAKVGVRRTAEDADAPPPVIDEAFAERVSALSASIRKKLASHEKAPAA